MLRIISNTVISINNSIIYSIINTPIPRGVGIAAVSLYINYYNTHIRIVQVEKQLILYKYCCEFCILTYSCTSSIIEP